MRPQLITTQPLRWQRRTRVAGRAVGDVVLLIVHLAVAVIVLAVRVPYTLLGIAARAAARAELALSARTGRPPLGQIAGMTLAIAFVTEFRTAYRQTTR